MSRTYLWAWAVVVCLFSVPMVCAQSQPASDGSSGPASVAAVPRLIKFSGAVRDARGEPLGNVAVRLTFAVYSEQQGGAALWVESQVAQLDEQGHYSVLLGATRADGLPAELFPAGKARWLGVQVEGRDEDPRVLLVSVPYALKAEDAAMLGGRSAADFVLAEQLKEEVKTQVEAQKPALVTGAVEMLVSNPPKAPAIAEGPSTFTCATTGDCVAVTQSGTGRALRPTATSASETVLVQQNGTGYGLRALAAGNVALYGQITGSAGTSYGVKGLTTSTTGAGVFGYNLAATGLAYGVLGQTASAEGTAFFGRATATTGATIGLRGHADSTSGIGILGQATATSGVTTGLVARVFSADGTALVVDNTKGGKLLSAQVNGAEKFSVSGGGNVSAGEAVFTGSRVAGAALVADNTAGGQIFSGRNNGTEKFSVNGDGNVVATRVTAFSDTFGPAVNGVATAGSGVTYGVMGDSQSTSGAGVKGTGAAVGVEGEALFSGGVGVRGITWGTTAASVAGLFQTKSIGSGPKLLSGRDSSGTEVFSVTNTGTVYGRYVQGGAGFYSGTSAGEVVSVLQNGPGSGLTGTTLGISATSAGIKGLATSYLPDPNYSYAAGVYGLAAGMYGSGVYGGASSPNGVGVKGESLSSLGGIGVLGVTPGTGSYAIGVSGQATGSTGNGVGVFGTSASTSGIGVSGNATNNIGVLGGGNIGVEGWGSQTGVLGSHSDAGIGVHGKSDHGTAIKAEVPSNGYYLSTAVLATTATSQDGTTGVYGWTTNLSGATIGVHGRSDSSFGTGVLGEATDQYFANFGVKGTSQSLSGTAVAAIASNGGIGVYGESDSDIAGDFNRTDDSDSGVILQARNGDDVEFRVLGNGNVYADGTFTGGGADFAEAMAVRGDRDQYEPGDVLIIDPTGDRQLTLARQAYSSHVAGIYSTKPGMLGKPYPMDDPRGAKDIPLAIVGIVPCKVSAENGPIGRGDLLVSASAPGHAMRGTDRDRMLGAIVGKALESLASGTGVIQVLVTLQ